VGALPLIDVIVNYIGFACSGHSIARRERGWASPSRGRGMCATAAAEGVSW
jgi:hypothetical protein